MLPCVWFEFSEGTKGTLLTSIGLVAEIEIDLYNKSLISLLSINLISRVMIKAGCYLVFGLSSPESNETLLASMLRK